MHIVIKIDATPKNKILERIQEAYPKDWLLTVEIYELAVKNKNRELATKSLNYLHEIKLNRPEIGHLIDDGIKIADEDLVLK